MSYLERQTLIETKNRTLKCLKWHCLTVLMEDGAFALCFRPHPGHLTTQTVPALGNLPSKAKNANT